MYDVRKDPGKINIQNWSKVAMDEDALNIIVEQAKTHNEVQRQEQKNTSIMLSIHQEQCRTCIWKHRKVTCSFVRVLDSLVHTESQLILGNL
jgi:hypothetical protein